MYGFSKSSGKQVVKVQGMCKPASSITTLAVTLDLVPTTFMESTFILLCNAQRTASSQELVRVQEVKQLLCD